MSHVTILGMGTCGDLQPLGALARALRERGHEVQFLTIPDYEDLVHPYGVPFVPVGPRLDDLVRRPEFDRLISQKFEISNFWRCARILREAMYEILEDVVRKVTATDIVVFNPIACFGTHLARSLNVPSLRVLAQPMLPSWKEPCSLWMSSGAFPGPINRVSYEVGRLMLLAFNLNRPVGGRKIRIGRWFNPLTDALDESAQLLAASGSLCGNPGDWPAAVEAAGFWFQQPAPGETLPDELQSFLSAGPAPLYVGFGSMNWNAKAITDKVLTALREWGGRAVLGAGGFTPDAELPPNVFRGGIVSHTLLFPHVSGVVHHGGAGTTAAGLRFGRPTQVLPVLGDQMYWGRRIEATGAGPDPVRLHKIKADELARRFALLTETESYRQNAARLAEAISRDPGPQAGAEAVERHLETSRRALANAASTRGGASISLMQKSP